MKISSSAGFTNIAVLIGLALFLLPAAKLALNNPSQKPQGLQQKIAGNNKILIGCNTTVTNPPYQCDNTDDRKYLEKTSSGSYVGTWCNAGAPYLGRCIQTPNPNSNGNYCISCEQSACAQDCSYCASAASCFDNSSCHLDPNRPTVGNQCTSGVRGIACDYPNITDPKQKHYCVNGGEACGTDSNGAPYCYPIYSIAIGSSCQAPGALPNSNLCQHGLECDPATKTCVPNGTAKELCAKVGERACYPLNLANPCPEGWGTSSDYVCTDIANPLCCVKDVAGKGPDNPTSTPTPNPAGATAAPATATPRAGAATATPTPIPYVPPAPGGYCTVNSNGNVNSNPKWYKLNGNPACNFSDTSYTPGTNRANDNYCARVFGGQNGWFYACPGTAGGSGATIICDGHGGVDGSNFPNGYVAPICTNTTPTKDNWSTFVFNAGKAQRQEYKDYKNYDVFLCTDNSYDFAPKPPKPGNSDVCNKYPWTQDASGALPTNPPGHPCNEKNKPYWDGQACTFRPGACNRTGWTGKENICQTNDCANGNSPDIQPGEDKTEANLACTSDRGQTSFCCSKPAPTLAPGETRAPTQAPTATPAAGSATATPTSAPSGGGTGTEYSHCYHGDSNNECDSHYKCNNPNGGASAYCVYKNPSESDAYCQSGANHCETGSRCTTNQNGLHMGDTYACQRANLGTICCTGAAGSGAQPANPTATPATAAPTATPKPITPTATECNAQTTSNGSAKCSGTTTPAGCDWKPGTEQNQADTYCLGRSGSTAYCYLCAGSTASTGQVVTACITNVQCINANQGNACVFYGASSIGVCKTIQ